jgi:transketolase
MPKFDAELIKNLEEKAYEIRTLAIRLMANGHLGHPGGSLSEAEILAALYFYELKIDPSNPQWQDRDRFVLSKANACNAQYAALALRGYFPVQECFTYGAINSRLQSHPDMCKTPGVDMTAGSLGQAFSTAVGMAWACRYAGRLNHIFCMIGDGECQEGQIWEAAMSAAHYKLDNLTAVLDYNKVQAKGFIYDEINIEPLRGKWEAFGWQTIEIDGHDIEQVLSSFYKARWINRTGKPTIIIAHTVKGKGVPWMEFNSAWHTHAPTGEKAEQALEELAKRYKKPYKRGSIC